MGAGGGGGYYGGGGGAFAQSGGGGAGFAAPSMTSVVSETGVRTGDGNITFTWDLQAPAVTVSALPSTGSMLGDPVTFTATVTGSHGLPAGTVRFEADGIPISGCEAQTLAAGTAQCATTALPAGSTALRAAYVGNKTYAATTSAAIDYNVAYPPLKITTPTTLPNAVVGEPYSQQLEATGGLAPHAWAVATGTLPVGLSMSGSGRITGVPVGPTAQPTKVTVGLTDSRSTIFVVEVFTLSVDASAAFTSAAAVTFATGENDSFLISATGTPGATITHASGILPDGLTFNAGASASGTATISGTPAAGTGGLYPVVLTATNGVGTPAAQTLDITVNQNLSVVLDPRPAFVPAGTSATFSAGASGFPTPTVRWQVAGGTVAFTDIPGATSLTYTATNLTLADSGRRYRALFTQGGTPVATAEATLTVGTAPAITSTDAATFIAGQANTVTLTGSGSPAPKFSANSDLPAWATLTDHGDGTASLTGTPITGGSSTFTLTASNERAPDVTQIFTLTVDSAPVITSAGTASFTVGTAATVSVTSKAGYPIVTTVDIAGPLPAGLTATGGTLTGTPKAGTGGRYPLTVTVGNAGSAPAATQLLVLTVSESPAFTSANATGFLVGSATAFTVTTTGGFPTDVDLTVVAGSLPHGVTFVDNGDGTAALTGTAAAGTGGIHSVTLGADNGIAAVTPQPFTLTVNEAPTFTSLASATFTAGAAGATALIATPGFPLATTLALAGDQPAWLTLSAEGNGSATLTGTPPLEARGTFTFTVLATTSDGDLAAQSFSLTVTTSPTFSSAAKATFAEGTTTSFTVTTGLGVPAATAISRAGDLPAGITFVDNGDGTATMTGVPKAGTGGNYPVTLTATNQATRPAVQSFVLVVTEAASFTSAAQATFVTGISSTFDVTTTGGFPRPAALTVDGSRLPEGVTFTDNGDGSGVFAGMPVDSAVGVHPVRVLADNGAHSTAHNVLLTVAPPTTFALPSVLPERDDVLHGIPTVMSPGQVRNVSGAGFAPGTTVTVGIYSVPRTLGTAIVDSAGRFTASIQIPSDFVGTHTIVAVGADENQRARYLSVETTLASAAIVPGAPTVVPGAPTGVPGAPTIVPGAPTGVPVAPTVVPAESPGVALVATGPVLPITALVQGFALLVALGLALVVISRGRPTGRSRLPEGLARGGASRGRAAG